MIRKVRLLSSAAAMLLMGTMLLVVYANRQKPATGFSSGTAEAEPTTLPSETDAGTETETAEPTTEYPIPSYPAIPLEVAPVIPAEAELRIEAEDADITGLLEVEDIRAGYSGTGYLAGFSQMPGDSVSASFTVPSSQHYDITISVCADTAVTNALQLNGERIGEFTIDQSEHFVRVTFSGVYMEEGEATLSIEEIDGFFALDYFEISNYSEMYEMNYQGSYTLSDPNASEGAKKLMSFLTEQYGSKIISGQYCAGDADSEMELIYRQTGKYPAIRFGDVEAYSDNSTANGGDIIGACERWTEQGGIVGLMWHWDAPTGVSSVYAAQADFSLMDALPPYTVYNEIVEPEPTEPADPTEPASSIQTPTEPAEPEVIQRFRFSVDVALMEQEEIDELVENGTLSAECAAILRDIDSVAETLRPLAEKDIPVLWRPLHEASGDWFWWGADGPEPYRWLWDVMYRRMTQYHDLHNLIWMWNGQSGAYLVDNYDIASLDIYLSADKTFGSRYEQFVSLSRMTGGEKLLALSETSSVPDPNLMFRDNTIWSFFGLWYGEYLVDENGRYSEKYTSAEDMVTFYNSEAVITLDDTKVLLAE